jgi:hypothetical protein
MKYYLYFRFFRLFKLFANKQMKCNCIFKEFQKYCLMWIRLRFNHYYFNVCLSLGPQKVSNESSIGLETNCNLKKKVFLRSSCLSHIQNYFFFQLERKKTEKNFLLLYFPLARKFPSRVP